MRANKVHRQVCRDIKLRNGIVAAVKTRQPEPTLLVIGGYAYLNRWIAVNERCLVPEAMVAVGAIDLDGEYAFVLSYLQPVKSLPGLF